MTRHPFDPNGRRLLGAILVAHLLVNAIHGLPHMTVPVVAPPLVNVAVALVVFALPVTGYLLVRRGYGRGGWATFTVGLTLSFLIAGTLHFVVPGPDNVAAAPASTSGLVFVGTAVIIQLVDGIGIAIGVLGTVGRATVTTLPSSGRIEGVPDAGLRPLARSTYWLSRRFLGEVPEPLAVTAHHPTLLVGVNAVELALDRADELDDELAELATLQAARVAECEFCLDIGTALATESDVPAVKLRELHRYEASDAFTERERIVLRYADAMTRTPVAVSAELFDAVATEFDEAAQVELTATIAFENYRARFNSAVGIDSQDFAEELSCPVPEPRSATRDVAGADPGS